MLHRGGGRTTEPQYCRIRHPVRQKRKGLVRTHRRFRPQDRNTSRRASAIFAHFALHASPIRGSYHSHPPPRSDTAFHSRRRADAPSSSGIFAGRGRIRTAPPRHVLRRFRRQMAHAELERRRNEGKNDRSDLSRTEINRPKILQTLKNVLSLRRKTNGKRRKMDNHVPFFAFSERVQKSTF